MRSYGVLSGLFAIVLLLAGGCTQWTSKRALDRGAAALKRGDYAAAVVQLEKASRHIADAPQLYYNLGTAYYNLNRYDQAVKAFETALELAPTNREAMIYLGNLHLKRQEWTEAARQFQRAGENRPPDAELLASLAQAANGAGRTDAARLCLIQALRADHTYAPAYYDLACLYDQRFMLPVEAVDAYQLFLQTVNSKDPHVEKARASIVRLQQVISRMQPTVPAGAKRDPAKGLQLAAEGDRQRAARQMDKAAKAYRDALAADPLCHDALYGQAQIARAKSNLAETYKWLRAAVAIEPVRQQTLLECAQAAMAAKDYANAGRWLDRAIARWPALAAPYASLAVVRQMEGHAADARLYAEQFVRLSPPGPDRDRYQAWARTLPQ